MHKKRKLSGSDLALLNSKNGHYALLKNEVINIDRALEETKYLKSLKKQQIKLIRLQNWVIENDKKIVVLFEGRDAAGKGGAIRRMTEYINPRHYRIVALNIPTEDERKQWFFQRYINELPKPGEIVFFDRSWYNRAVVEPINGFCTLGEYKIFMNQVNEFERMIMESDTHLVKLYFSITKKEQARRFKDIKSDPLKRWKMTPVDERAQELWDMYTEFKEDMFTRTNTSNAPWIVIDANKKSAARLAAINHVLDAIDFTE